MSASAFEWQESPAAYKAYKDHLPPKNPPSVVATQATTTTHALVKDRSRGNQPGPSAQVVQYSHNHFRHDFLSAQESSPKLNLKCINSASTRFRREQAAQDAFEDGSYAGAGSSSTGPTSYGGTTFATGSSWGFPQNSQRGNGKDKEPKRGGDDSNRDGSFISSSQKTGPLWACPYFIFALIFGELCPDACHGFSRIGDVRQHIDRRHRQPPHCPSCGRTYAARQKRELEAHINQRRCTPVPFELPGVTDDQWDEIRARGRAAPHTVNGGDSERWFQIWDVLFPGVERPPSPFMNGSILTMRSRDFTQRFMQEGRGWSVINQFYPMAPENPRFVQGLHDLIKDALESYVTFVGERDDGSNGHNHQPAPP
ncbi:hypothetical protein PG989_016381 [Apiospora arundinis]